MWKHARTAITIASLAVPLAGFGLATPASAAELTLPVGSTQATYRAEPNLRSTTLGANTGARGDARLCRWQAQLVVTRQIAAQGTANAPAPRQIHLGKPVHGMLYGACNGQAQRIAAAAAAKLGDASALLASLAQQDQALLLAELEGLRQPA